MNNRNGGNEKKFNISREHNDPNQSEKKESPLCIPFDHIYARQADSAERKPVRSERAEDVADDKVPAGGSNVRHVTSKLFTAYTPHFKTSEWRPGEQEKNTEATYQSPIVENKTPGGIADIKQGSIAARRPLHREKTVHLSTQCSAVDDKVAASGSSMDTKKATKKLITIYASKRSASRPEQQDKSKEFQSQFITTDNKDSDTDKVKKLSERLMAVYTRMKNSEKKSMQQVPLELAAQYIFPPSTASHVSGAFPGSEQASKNMAACDLAAALGRQEHGVDLAGRFSIDGRGPNEFDDVHHMSNSFVLTSQFKQLRELLVYHLDLIQNLNETITSTTKLYQDLKDENDTLKNVIKRKALPGSPHFALSHAASRNVVTTSVATCTATSLLAPSRPHNHNEMGLSHRDNSSTRKMFGPVRSEVARLSTSGVPSARSYLAQARGSHPPATSTLTLSSLSSCLTSPTSTPTPTPTATITSRDLAASRHAITTATVTSTSTSASTATAEAADTDFVTSAHSHIGRSRSRSRSRLGRSLSLKRASKPAAVSLPLSQLTPTGKSRGTRTFSANKKPKMISSYGKDKGDTIKRTKNFGSLSDRLQLIDTTPTGEDPYQLGEADMREQSPIPKLMLQKASLSRRKICSGTSFATGTDIGTSTGTGMGLDTGTGIGTGMGLNTETGNGVGLSSGTDTGTGTGMSLGIGIGTGTGTGTGTGAGAQKRTTIYDLSTSDGTLKSNLKSNRYTLDSPIKYTSITEQPPKTLMTEDPDTESEGAWRVADEPRGSADFSYGDASNELVTTNSALMDFQNIFAAAVPNTDDTKPADVASEEKPTPAPKKRRGRKGSGDQAERSAESALAPKKRRGRKSSATATDSSSTRRNTTRGKKPPATITSASLDPLCSVVAADISNTGKGKKSCATTSSSAILDSTELNPEESSLSVRPKKRGKNSVMLDDPTMNPGDSSYKNYSLTSILKTKKGRRASGASEVPEALHSAESGGIPQSSATSAKRSGVRSRSRNTSTTDELKADLSDPTTSKYTASDYSLPLTTKRNRGRTTSGTSDLPEGMYSAESGNTAETSSLVPKRKSGRQRSRNTSMSEELQPDVYRAVKHSSTNYSLPLDSKTKTEWPFSGALSLSETMYSNEPSTVTNTLPTTPKKRRVRSRSRNTSATKELPVEVYSPVKDNSSNYPLSLDTDPKYDWTYSDDINYSISFYSKQAEDVAKSSPSIPKKRRGRPRSRTTSTTDEMPADNYDPIKSSSANYSLPLYNEALMAPLYSTESRGVGNSATPAPKRRSGRSRSRNASTSSELPSNYSLPLYSEAMDSSAPTQSAESSIPESAPKSLLATTKTRGSTPSRNTSTTGDLPADVFSPVEGNSSTNYSLPMDTEVRNEWPYSSALNLSETLYSAELGNVTRPSSTAPKRGRGRPQSRNTCTTEEPSLEGYRPVKDGSRNYPLSLDTDAKDEWTYSDDINYSVSFYSKRTGNVAKSSSTTTTTKRSRGRPRSRTTSTNNEVPPDMYKADKESEEMELSTMSATTRKKRGRPPTVATLHDYEMSLMMGGAAGGAARGRGGRGGRGRQRAHSTTVLAHLYDTPPSAHDTARRDRPAPAPCKTTREPYHTELGNPDLPWTLSSEDEVATRAPRTPRTTRATRATTATSAIRASEQSLIEVPRWREKPYPSLTSAEGTEPLDDRERERRHRKLEAEEKRQQRWYVRRLREERHTEHLRRRERARSGAPPAPPAGPALPASLLHPAPHDALYIELTDRLPVAAFGEPLPDLPPKPFMLKWMKISKALKRLKRSQTLQ